MIYEIIVGKHPYDCIDNVSTYKLLNGIRAKIPNFVPAPLAELIRKAWSSKPEERPSAHEILSCLGNEDYVLKGTNWDRYMKYYKKVFEVTDPVMSQKARDLFIKCETGDLLDWYAFAKQIITEDPENPMIVKLAVRYLEKSVNEEFKFYLAAYELGKIYIKKQEPELMKRAVELFRIGADHLHAESMFELAKCLKDGNGTEKSPKKAAELFNKAGQFGFVDSYIEYVNMICNADNGVPCDKNKGKCILAALYDETKDERINNNLYELEEN